MKKILSLVSILVLFTANAFATIPTVGDVTGKMGTTWVERDFENITIDSAGFELYMEDFLQTGEDGAMNIEFVDGTKVTIAPNSEMIIDEFAFDTDVVPIVLAMNLDVNVGTFTYESGAIALGGGEVAINTPSATITVLGTAFSGTVDTSGKTTITLLPDSSGNVGQVTVRNEAGAMNINQAYTSVTVLSDSLMPSPPSPLDSTEKKELFDLDTVEEVIEEKVDEQADRKTETKKLEQVDEGPVEELEKQDDVVEDLEVQEEKKVELDSFDVQEEQDVEVMMEAQEENFDIEVTEEAAQDLEADIMKKEDLSADVVMDTTSTVVIQDDFGTVEPTVEPVEDIIIDDTATEIDTSYYDQWDEYALDEEYGWVDEDNQVTVWDASGEVKMDYDESKQMWAEMDQAYYDAIGCEGDCNWDNINWDEVDWDAVDWDAYDKAYNDTLEKYGLEPYDWDEYYDTDVTDDVFDDTDEIFYDDEEEWDDEWDPQDYYEQAEGPYLITGEEDWCKDASWCDEEYITNSNEWAQADWDLNTKFDSWNKESKALFETAYLNEKWYGDTKEAPKPWNIPELKDKYMTEWTWDDWDTWWITFDEWYFSDYYDNWESTYEEISLEEEYAFEQEELDDWEIEWLASIDVEYDCTVMGYYWDKANQSCGTEWVDNSGVDIKVTASGETINYETGDITQTVTTTTDGVVTSVTQTGRYSTYGNEGDVDASTGNNNWAEITRTHEGHTAHIHTGGSGVNSGNDSYTNFDVMIIQGSETQAIQSGTDGSRAEITIIQTD